MHDIAVIIINYNSSQFTVNAIKSIVKTTSRDLNYQIIVIDNASKYEDFLALQTETTDIPNLELIRSKLNTGFGAGNMFGIQFANAKFYAFINNDTLLLNDCLSELKHFMESHTKVALCAPQGYDENKNVLHSFDHFLTLRRELFGRSIFEFLYPKTYPKRNIIYSNPIKVQCIPGSFLFVDSQAFNAVGGFDSNIFLYYEETDLAYRMSKLKQKNECYLVPSGKYIHFIGKSTSPSLLIKKELKISLLYVLKKNSSYLSYLFLRSYLTITYTIKSLVKPRYFKLAILLLKGAPLSESLKQSQIILNK